MCNQQCSAKAIVNHTRRCSLHSTTTTRPLFLALVYTYSMALNAAAVCLFVWLSTAAALSHLLSGSLPFSFMFRAALKTKYGHNKSIALAQNINNFKCTNINVSRIYSYAYSSVVVVSTESLAKNSQQCRVNVGRDKWILIQSTERRQRVVNVLFTMPRFVFHFSHNFSITTCWYRK